MTDYMEHGRRMTDDGCVYRYVVVDKQYWLELMEGEPHLGPDGFYSEKTEEVAWEVSGFEACVGRAGQWFWASPSVRISRNRVLVRQFGGYDV